MCKLFKNHSSLIISKVHCFVKLSIGCFDHFDRSLVNLNSFSHARSLSSVSNHAKVLINSKQRIPKWSRHRVEFNSNSTLFTFFVETASKLNRFSRDPERRELLERIRSRACLYLSLQLRGIRTENSRPCGEGRSSIVNEYGPKSLAERSSDDPPPSPPLRPRSFSIIAGVSLRPVSLRRHTQAHGRKHDFEWDASGRDSTGHGEWYT